MLVSGTEDGELCLWSMNSYNLQSTIKGTIKVLSFSLNYF